MGRQGHGPRPVEITARYLDAQAHAVAVGERRIGAQRHQHAVELLGQGPVALDLLGEGFAAPGQLVAR